MIRIRTICKVCNEEEDELKDEDNFKHPVTTTEKILRAMFNAS